VFQVELKFQSVIPPEQLYHGTARHFLKTIEQQGLVKGKRHHVHLSTDIQTASKVGKRHGQLIIFLIDSKKMHNDGHQFYLSDNQIYLVDHVPPNYLTVIN
jgi:putative RNA 2'-phosphotransferase